MKLVITKDELERLAKEMPRTTVKDFIEATLIKR